MSSRLVFAVAAVPALAAAFAAGDLQRSKPSAVSDAKDVWTRTTAFVQAAAEQAPDSVYAYRPTPDVRTYGQLVAHIAGAQRVFCALALGEKPPAEDAIEKTMTAKADLVAALKSSTDYCQRAYGQTDAAVQARANFFGRDVSRMYVLVENAAHNSLHYGNMVTYLRMNGMVPPSSQPSP